MSDMSDNEMDKLFREQFANVEIIPSKDYWEDISTRINPEPQRKISFLWWVSTAAAAVLILIFLRPKTGKIKLVKPAEEIAATIPSAPITEPEAEIMAIPPVNTLHHKAKETKVKVKKSKIEIVSATHQEEKQIILAAMQPELQNNHLSVKEEVIKAVEKTETTPKEMMITAINIHQLEENMNISSVTEIQEESRTPIRNVGDLVNLVIAKVDKRAQKLIRFNTDEDDNTSIVGVNIGFLKLNKRNRD